MRPAAEAACLIMDWRAVYAEWRSCVPVIVWGTDNFCLVGFRTVC